MKQIIDGKTYNTDTAELVQTYRFEDIIGSGPLVQQSLYHTNKYHGKSKHRYFIVTETKDGSFIKPLTKDSIQAWMAGNYYNPLYWNVLHVKYELDDDDRLKTALSFDYVREAKEKAE